MNKLKVAVIGGGAAGLCAARYMAARPDRFEPVVYEKTERVGGTWVYTEETGNDKYGLPIHSSMYSSLLTNLPKEVMAFPDFPFDSKLPSFIKHTEMLRYLEQYAQHFNLLKYIQFNTLVDSIRPLKSTDESQPTSWEVKVRDVKNLEAAAVTLHYDAVMVCNGHYAIPKISDIEGIDTFPGQILHSHNYRHPTIFKDQTVLVVGAGASGIDISLDIAPCAKQVYISHWRPRFQTPLPPNIKEVQAIKSLQKNQVKFMDEFTADVDAILFCSGYNYDFSFVHPDCGVDVNDGRLTPLYKHLVNWKYPTLAIVGIAVRICPYPHFHAQVKFFLAALDGSMKLPSREEMAADEERDYQARLTEGLPHRYAHFMGPRMWGYQSELLRMAGEEQPKPVVERLYDQVGVYRRTDVPNYKKMNFKLLDDERFQQLKSVEM